MYILVLKRIFYQNRRHGYSQILPAVELPTIWLLNIGWFDRIIG